jgi:redox-sensitive bicupin YhaK (pirin superfamily)
VWTRDGAGVKLYRVFGDPAVAELTDPFLLLDHFGSATPTSIWRGFPGIRTGGSRL